MLNVHVKHFRRGPSLILCLMAVNSVKRLLDCLGHCNPNEARMTDLYSLRATYGVDEIDNGIYGKVLVAVYKSICKV